MNNRNVASLINNLAKLEEFEDKLLSLCDKRSKKGATDEQIISWLTRLRDTTWEFSIDRQEVINNVILALRVIPTK